MTINHGVKEMTNYKKARVKTELYLDLTEEQLRLKADLISKRYKEINDLKEEFSKIRKHYAGKIKDLTAGLDALTEDHESGKESRSVECYQVWDLDNKKTWFEYEGKKVDYTEQDMTNYEVKQVTAKRLFNDGPDLPGVQHQPGTETSSEAQAGASVAN
jgi:hypothetical protein